ncbi:MAG: hypothetical protein ACRYGI_11560 [Janthinobacterium lividum]
MDDMTQDAALVTHPDALTPDEVPAIQADREFAARWIIIAPENQRLIRAGEWDHHHAVQATARHRLAASDHPDERGGEALREAGQTIEILRRALAWHGDPQRMATTREEWQQEIDAAIVWVKANPEPDRPSFSSFSTPAAPEPTEAGEWRVPGGWVLVPIDPIREMWAAGGNAVVGYKQRHHDKVVAQVWADMLAARPSLPGGMTA